MRDHSLAEDEKLLHSQRFADLRAGLSADDHRLDLGQVSLEILGILMKEELANHRPENGVAQEFQPLVGGQTVFGAGGVGQGGLQQILVRKTITDSLLAVGYQRCKRGKRTGLFIAAHESTHRPRRFSTDARKLHFSSGWALCQL